MTTIELTPDVVFERTDGGISPVSAYYSPTGTTARPTATRPPGRGYHSMGSATLPTRGRKGGTKGSEYGVMISIKDIKGHPFVVLEDKDKQKHMVQAPENDSHPSVVSPSRSSGYSPERGFGDVCSSSDTHPTSSVLSGIKRQMTPSPVPRNRPAGFGRELGRSKITNNAKARSRSLSPGRAAQERRNNRARSVSPPRRERVPRQVDSENIKPINSLIGFFETGPQTPDSSAKTMPNKVKLVGSGASRTSRIRDVTKRMNAERMASPTSTVSSNVSSSVDVSLSSQASNLTVTTVDSPIKVGQKPEGRYFALTSPGPLTSKGTFTMPRLSSVLKPSDYSTLPARKSTSASPYLGVTHNQKQSNGTPKALPVTQCEKKQPNTSPFRGKAQPASSLATQHVKEEAVIPKQATRAKRPMSSFLNSPTTSPKPDNTAEPASQPTHISKAKFMGPSQMLLKKTRRKRSATKLSMASSEGEYSESEYSDAESLKLGDEAYKYEDDEIQNLNQEISEITAMGKQSTDFDEDARMEQLAHRRTPSIKFEKIASEDVSKRVEKEELDLTILEEKKRADGLEEDLKTAQDKIKDLEKEIAGLNVRIAEAESAINMKNRESELLKKEVTLLKKNLKEASSSDEEKETIMGLQRGLRSVRREKTALEETITLLESQKTTLKSQLQDVKREREDDEIQIRALKHEVDKQSGRCGEQERDMEGVKRELARARRQTEAQICDLEQQLTKAEKKSRNLKIENSALEKQLYDMKHDRMASSDQEAQVNETMRQLEQSKLKALQELEAAHTEIDDKSRALREADRKNNKLQEELRRMDQNMEDELTERESTLEESRQADQKFRDLTAQFQVVNREIEMLKKELESAETKSKLAEAKLDETQNLIEEKDLKMERLTKDNKVLHKQLEEDSLARLDLNKELHKRDKDNQMLGNEIADLKKRLREAEIELSATKDALDDARKELEKVSKDTKREREKSSKLDSDARDRREEYERVKSTLDHREQALKNAREAIAKIESQMNEYEDSHSVSEREKMLIEADRDRARRETKRLKDQVDSQSKQMGDANKTIKDLQEKLADDRKASHDGNERIAQLKKELAGLQDTVDEKTQQVFSAEETIYRQKEVIEEMTAIQQSAEKSALMEMEKFMAETEKQFDELRKELTAKDEKIKTLKAEKKELEEELDELEQQHPQYEDDREKEEELVNLSQKLQEEEEEKKQIFGKLQMAHDKLGNALNEIEIEKSRVQVLMEEKARHKEEVDELKLSIKDLEDRFEQEAKELVNIKAHHKKTEMKLRDVLKQAQEETDKAVSEREALTVHAEALEKQVEDAERAAERAELGKQDIERDLQQQSEANYKLQQTLAALGIGHSSSNSEGKGSLLTSV